MTQPTPKPVPSTLRLPPADQDAPRCLRQAMAALDTSEHTRDVRAARDLAAGASLRLPPAH